MERNLNRINWQTVKKLLDDGYRRVLLPVGTIEAHGAIPLGTDNIIPETMAERIAEDCQALIAPTVNYGVTKSLIAYPGSLTVSSETFTAYMYEIMSSLKNSGFDEIIVLNGHGGHIREMKEAAYKAHFESDAKVAVIEWWELCGHLVEKHYGTTGGHAAVDETAAVIACAPETVTPELYDEEMLYHVRPGTTVYPNPSTILIYQPDSGYVDFDQKKADAYFDDVCVTVIDFIKDIISRWEEM